MEYQGDLFGTELKYQLVISSVLYYLNSRVWHEHKTEGVFKELVQQFHLLNVLQRFYRLGLMGAKKGICFEAAWRNMPVVFTFC